MSAVARATWQPIDAMGLLLHPALSMSGGAQQGCVFTGDQANRNAALHQGLHLLFMIEGGKQGGKGEVADQRRRAGLRTAGFKFSLTPFIPSIGSRGFSVHNTRSLISINLISCSIKVPN